MSSKYTQEAVAKIFSDAGCTLMGEFKDINIKLSYICSCGRESSILLNSFMNGHRCMGCGSMKRGAKKRVSEVEVRALLACAGNELIEISYEKKYAKIKYMCKCGSVKTTALSNVRNGCNCIKCGSKKRGSKRKHTFDDVYQYFLNKKCQLLETEYHNNRTPMKYMCSCGNISHIRFSDFKRGMRCLQCGRSRTAASSRKTIEEVKKYFAKHGCILLTDKYVNSSTPMPYICTCGNKSMIRYCDFKQGKRCWQCGIAKKTGKNCSLWKGGVTGESYVLYDTYAEQVSWLDTVRRDPDDNRILNVSCTYCGKWFRPERKSISARIRYFQGKVPWEGRLYCSDECKHLCPVYNQNIFPKGFVPEWAYDKRYDQGDFRKMVLERDDYTCVKCGFHSQNGEHLYAHHIAPVKCNPIESLDIDNGACFCKECHDTIHSQRGCTHSFLRQHGHPPS
ncbi:HNH endonuclease [Desulfovibrio subterraneus]|uniref:HNH endonuclease signature motif containing protein n=1 Tax=Desulfovibrio subterraneus TaxID=2718620 RepID=UPI0022B92688|nr:HNH endonuclease signature motif containing protein [Desulfovibrio subterraneus]WBF68503.1 HNH endonuclease [Desulfovibrio subterraneus]